MERKRIKFTLSWEDVQAWTLHLARKYAWQFAPEMDEYDLLQEGFFVYLRCRDKYAAAARNARHLVALYKTSYRRKLLNLAVRGPRRRAKRQRCASDLDVNLDGLAAQGDHAPSVLLRLTLEDAPGPIKRLVDRLVDADLRPRRQKTTGGRSETLDKFLCRVAGVRRQPMERRVRSFVLGESVG